MKSNPLWILAMLAAITMARAGTVHLVAISGEAPPDGNGVFSTFTAPALNNAGVACFRATMQGHSGALASWGIYCGTPAVVARVARGDQMPSVLAGGKFLESAHPGAINDAGEVAFKARVSPNGGLLTHAVLRKGSTRDRFTMQARSQDVAPDEGNFGDMNQADWRPALGPAGHVAFFANLTGTDGGTTDDSAVFRSGAAGDAVVRIAQEGQTVPGGVQAMTGFSKIPAVNAAGQVACCAFLTGMDFPEAVVRGDGAIIERVAGIGDSVAGLGNIAFIASDGVMMNSVGEAAFAVSTDGFAGTEGIVRGSSPGSLAVVAALGQAIPDSGRKISYLEKNVTLNDTGQVAYTAGTLTDADTDFQPALMLDQTIVALGGQPVPGGDATFFGFLGLPFALNGNGLVAFKAYLDVPGTGNPYGLYLSDGSGVILEIAREGAPLFGGTVTALDFAGNTYYDALPNTMNGINDAGEVAFRFMLADGRQGIALWSPLPKAVTGAGDIQPVAGGFRVSFPAISGWDYVIERNEVLLSPWGNPTAPLRAAADGWVSFDDLGPGLPPRRFYRATEAP